MKELIAFGLAAAVVGATAYSQVEGAPATAVETSEYTLGQEYAEQYGITAISYDITEFPDPENAYAKIQRFEWTVTFADGKTLVNPSVIKGELRDNAPNYSEADISVYRNVQNYLWNN